MERVLLNIIATSDYSLSTQGPYESYTTSAKPLTRDDGDYVDSSRPLLDDSESSTDTFGRTQGNELETFSA